MAVVDSVRTRGQQPMFDNCCKSLGESDLSGEMFVNCNDLRNVSGGQPSGYQPAPLLVTCFWPCFGAVDGGLSVFCEELFDRRQWCFFVPE